MGQFAWRDASRLPRTRAPSAALPAAAEGFSASWAVPGRSARAALPCSGTGSARTVTTVLTLHPQPGRVLPSIRCHNNVCPGRLE